MRIRAVSGARVMLAVVIAASGGAGCRGGRLAGDDASAGALSDASFAPADGGATATDAGTPASDASVETAPPPADAGSVRPPVACPTVPAWPLPTAGAPAGCMGGPPPVARDTVVPDGANPAFRRCGALGEQATGLTFSPDGRRLAVQAGEAVHLYDTVSWREIARIVHASEPIDAAAFSPDGERLATVSSHLGQLAVWNTDDGSLLRLAPREPATNVFQLAAGAGLAFSSDGRRVATAIGTIVDVETGATVQLPNGGPRAGRNYEMWFMPGDRAVGALTMYHSGNSWVGLVFEQYDAETGARLGGVGDDAALSADRSTVAGRGQWSRQLSVVRLLPDGSSAPRSFASDAYAPFDRLLAVTAHGESLLVKVGSAIEARAAADPTRVLSRIELPPDMAFVAMSPADEVVTTGSCGTVAWDWKTGAAVWAQRFEVAQISWAAGRGLAAATGPDALWRVWRTGDGAQLCFAPHQRAVTRRVYSPDGGTVALNYDGGGADVRDADLGNARLVPFDALAEAGSQIVAVSRGGGHLVVWAGNATRGHDLVVVDRISGKKSPRFPVDGSFAPAALVSADGRRLAYKSSASPHLRLIDPESGAGLVADDLNDALLGFDPDERRLAVLRIHPPEPQTILTYATVDGAPGDSFVMPPGNFGALAHDWSFAVGWVNDPTSFGCQQQRWPLGGGAAQTLTTRWPLGSLSLSTDGALLFDRGVFYHEFTGDYLELVVTDAVSGAVVQDFVDHDVTPSADGRRLFGQAGALFCR